MWQKLDAGFANRWPKTVPVSSKNETGVKFMPPPISLIIFNHL